MNTPTKSNSVSIWMLRIVCLALVIFVWKMYGDISTLQTDSATKIADAEKREKAAAADAVKWRREAEGLLAQNNPKGVAPGSESSDASAAGPKRNYHPEEVTAMVNNAGMQNMISSQQAAIIGMAYKDLLDRFKLSPEERDYMQKLLLEKQMTQVTLGMKMMDASLSPAERQALGQQIGQGMAATDAKISDFLNSDSDFAYYKSYSNEETEHTEVGMFESSLTGSDALDPATADSLANLLNDTRNNFYFTVDFYNKQNFANPAVLNAPTVNKFLDEQTQYQAQVAEKAAAVLSPAQLEAFKQNQAAMRQMTKMQLSNIVQMSSGGQ